MNNCSSIQYYKMKKENRQMTILLQKQLSLSLNSKILDHMLKIFVAPGNQF
jgi:hypothetical protein